MPYYAHNLRFEKRDDHGGGPARVPDSHSIVFSNGSRAAARIPKQEFAVGCLASLRARFTALDGVSWVQSGEVENALDR